MKIVITLIIIFILVSIWSCCKVAGDCSREEEKRDEQSKNG